MRKGRNVAMSPPAGFVILILIAISCIAPPLTAGQGCSDHPQGQTQQPAGQQAQPPSNPEAQKQQDDRTAAETRAEVPELIKFHEVIYQLWHRAWPNKDTALMKELLPQVKQDIANLQKAELPGILRDKKVKWDEGVKGVAAAAGNYEKALAGGELQPLLDSVEALHAGFEGLIRLTYPAMPEFDAYHQVLYRIYHHDWPDKNLDALRLRSEELATACATLQKAPIPKRHEAKTERLQAGFASLCSATGELKEAARGTDMTAIEHAVMKVHTSYQAAEKIFE